MLVDLALSSWASADCYAMDLGLGLRESVAVVRPRPMPMKGLVILLPRAPDGSVVAAVSLWDEGLVGLEVNAQFGLITRVVAEQKKLVVECLRLLSSSLSSLFLVDR